MAKKEAEKRSYYVPGQKKAKKPDKHAYGMQCVYCGKKLDQTVPEKDKLYAKATTRQFPVCCEECKKGVEDYVAADKKNKIHFYQVLTICMFMSLIGALFNKWWISFPGMIVGGLAFIIFPYPITSFETFLNYSIKGMTRLVRIIGLVILAAGVAFTVLSIMGVADVSFY